MSCTVHCWRVIGLVSTVDLGRMRDETCFVVRQVSLILGDCSLKVLNGVCASILATVVVVGGSQLASAADVEYVNPENTQVHTLVFESPDGKTLPATVEVQPYAGGSVLSGAKKQRIGSSNANYSRVSFSTGVTLNRKSLPTRAQFDGESQLCFSLPSSPSSVALSSKYTVKGIGISGSVSGSGATLTGGPTSKTATTKISKKNPSKKTCVSTVDRGISFTGAIAKVQEKVVGEVVYKGTKYTLQVGDE